MRVETEELYSRVHHRVDEIMHYIWDPIGVAGTPQARDEYDSYVPQVIKRLLADAKAEAIAEYLDSIESDAMGLTRLFGRRKETSRAAELLVESYKWIMRPR
jgi:hypothetical protein